MRNIQTVYNVSVSICVLYIFVFFLSQFKWGYDKQMPVYFDKVLLFF